MNTWQRILMSCAIGSALGRPDSDTVPTGDSGLSR